MKKLYNSCKLLLALVALGLSMNTNAQTTTFSTTGTSNYTVPAGVSSVRVNVQGAKGGLNNHEGDFDDSAGNGACVQAYLAVSAGQVLTVWVGGQGGLGTATTGGAPGSSAPGFTGGNGANFTGDGGISGGGGGGASLIMIGGVPAVIAGGGGGAAALAGGNAERGGNGGGTGVGETGGETAPSSASAVGGGGGGSITFGAGGLGGTTTISGASSGSNGGNAPGGIGGDAGANSTGGGGGGGYAGGGGGSFSGGGGGGDYVNNAIVYFGTVPSDTRGCNLAPNGSVSITVSCTVNPITGVDSVCTGSTTPLFDASPGGLWSTTDPTIAYVNSTSGLVTGTATGTSGGATLITYTLGTGCLTTYLVTVNPLPPAFASPSFVCVGSTLTTLSESVTGKWSISDTSRAKIDSVSGVVTGDSSGSATIFFTSAAGACTNSGLLIINPVPDSIRGIDSVCQLGSQVLTDVTTGVGLTWTATPSGIVSLATAGATVTVTGTTAGTTTISYSYPSGCAATVVFTVDPLPSVIGGPSAICVNDTVEAETNTITGGTWSLTPVTLASINPLTGVIRPAGGTGTVTVTYTTKSGCTKTKLVTLEAVPNPIGGPTQVCEHSSISLTETSSGGSWSSVFTAIGTVSSGGSVTGIAIAGGVDTIKYIITGTGCFAEKIVTVNPRPTVITGQTSYCVGTVGSLISGPSGGTWSNINVSTVTGSVDPTSGAFNPYGPGAGLDSIVYTLPVTGCLRLQVVTVNPVPVISGPTQVCIGSSVTLNTTIGGSWSANNGDVTLSPGPGISEVVVGASAGNVTLTEVVTATGCLATYNMTVNPLPSPIVGPTSVCELDSVSLSDPTTPGIWSSLSTTNATVGSSSGEVTGVSTASVTTTAIIVYSVTTTGCFTTLNMNINPAPAPWTPTKMCIGDPALTLVSSGLSGTWSSDNIPVAGVGSSTGIVTATGGTGTANITNTIASTGCFRTEVFTVNPLPAVITGPNVVCTGSTVTLHDASGTSTWTSSGGVSVGAGTGIVTGVTAPTGIVTFTLPTGCYVTYPITVNTSPAAITVVGGGSLAICSGQTITLNDATGASGTWSNSPLTVGTVSPTTGSASTTLSTGVTAGTTTVTYTAVNGCLATTVVTVNAFATISGANSVCQGSSTPYTAGGVSGTWSSSASAIGSIGSATGILTGISTGTDIITFTSASGGCEVSKTITVNPLAPDTVVALGPLTICPSGFVELTASTGAGLTYQWYNPGLISGATASTLTVLGSSPGVYTVHVSNGLCPSVSVPVTVNVSPIAVTIASVPAATSGTVNACVSVGVTLTATGTAGATFQWQSGGVAIPGATNATYTPTTNGTYSSVAANSTGCTVTSNTIVVNMVPSPAGLVSISGATTFCAGSSVKITSDTGIGYTYQWYDASGPILGETDTSFTATTSGSYYVIDQNPTGCSTTSATTIVNVNPLPTAAISVTGTDVFCQGSSASLTVPTVAGETYQWYRNGVLIPGAVSATYSATTSGTYEANLTLAGCSNYSASESLTEVTTPAILPLTSTSFCWGGSATLAVTIVSGAGPVTYQWYDGGVAIAGAVSATYTALVSGVYSCSVTVTNGGACPIVSTSATVTENPLPNPLVSFYNDSFHTQNTFVTYQWYKDAAIITGARDSVLRCIGSGRYTVDVTDINGCQSFSAQIPETCSGVSVPVTTAANMNINIFPNPAQNTVQVEAPMDVRAVISSMDGRVLIDQAAAKTISIGSLADGIYTIMLYDASNHMVKAEKLVKNSN